MVYSESFFAVVELSNIDRNDCYYLSMVVHDFILETVVYSDRNTTFCGEA